MNKNGFVSIIALILILALLSISLYSNELVVMNSSLSYSSLNKMTAYYRAEGQILTSLYNKENYREKIIPYLSRSIINKNFYSSLTIKDGKNNKILCKIIPDFPIHKGRYLSMETEARSKNVKLKLKSKLEYINDIFLQEKALIECSKLEFNKDPLYNLYENMDYYRGHPSFESPKKLSNLQARLSNSLIDLSTLDLDENKIILKLYEDELDKELTIINDYGELVLLEGIIYIEGDLYLESDLDFKGILVLKEGSLYLADGVSFTSKGIIICDNFSSTNEDLVDISYDLNSIYSYGPYFPGFFDLKILNWKY